MPSGFASLASEADTKGVRQYRSIEHTSLPPTVHHYLLPTVPTTFYLLYPLPTTRLASESAGRARKAYLYIVVGSKNYSSRTTVLSMCIVRIATGAGCGAREEGVPLVAAATDVGDDEVLPRANVHLVPALGVAVGVVELAREDGVACAGGITRSVVCTCSRGLAWVW